MQQGNSKQSREASEIARYFTSLALVLFILLILLLITFTVLLSSRTFQREQRGLW